MPAGRRCGSSVFLQWRAMRFGSFSFGSIEVDGTTYEHDLVIDRGDVRKRRKGPSKAFEPVMATRPFPWAKTSPGTVSAS